MESRAHDFVRSSEQDPPQVQETVPYSNLVTHANHGGHSGDVTDTKKSSVLWVLNTKRIKQEIIIIIIIRIKQEIANSKYYNSIKRVTMSISI